MFVVFPQAANYSYMRGEIPAVNLTLHALLEASLNGLDLGLWPQSAGPSAAPGSAAANASATALSPSARAMLRAAAALEDAEMVPDVSRSVD